MTAKLNTLKVTNILLFFFSIFGLWPTANKTFYKLFSAILLTVFSLAYTIFMIINLIAFTDMSELTDSMYMSLTEIALLLKIANFIFHHSTMHYLLATIQKFELETKTEIVLAKNRISGFFKLVIYYYCCVNWTATYIDVSALFVNEPIVLPYRGWYPIDWQYNRVSYWLVYMYQVIGMAITSNLNVTIELFPIFLLFTVSLEIEVLGLRLQNTQYSRHKSVTSVTLIKLIKLHQDILK